MNQLCITNSRESFQVEEECFGPFIVNGGSIFKKGMIVGMQDKMVNGLLFYDKQNFYGYSEKYGICLLSPHFEYQQIEYEVETPKRSPIQTTYGHDTYQTTTPSPVPLEIVFQDSMNYYVLVEEMLHPVFELELFYDLNSIVPCVQLVFINRGKYPCRILFKNKNVYLNQSVPEILVGEVIQFKMEYVHDLYLVSFLTFQREKA